jgi:hypothetical protein
MLTLVSMVKKDDWIKEIHINGFKRRILFSSFSQELFDISVAMRYIERR